MGADGEKRLSFILYIDDKQIVNIQFITLENLNALHKYKEKF